MEKVSQIIERHNKKKPKKKKRSERSIVPCNCRDKNNCPIN